MVKAQVDGECLFSVWPPKISSLEELDQVLAELGRMERVGSRVNDELASAVAACTSLANGKLVVQPGDALVPIPFAAWKEQLETAAEKWATRNREEILLEGRKSRKLNHGKFGFREAGGDLVAIEDFPDSGNPKILDGLLKLLRQSLLKLANFVDGGARFIEVKLSWRKKDLLKAYNDQEVTLSVVRKAGFEVSDEFDKFFLTPDSKAVESL
ncbi:MAG: host-nuclease inhibitor Gam family protein [Patescibacteria group bacterium]|nr:host-nuclease inhibitor Gam family protein [Patescibacteria group bacterium]